jgi:hypothetical protein
MVSGVRRSRAEDRRPGIEPRGGSTGCAMTRSIGVASATPPPYSPTLSEIAAATRGTPSPPRQ